MLSRKKILITGAGGFIGSHLCEELVRQGSSIRAMVKYNSFGFQGNLEKLPKDVYQELEIIPGDVRDPLCVSRSIQGCSTVFHLAALIGIPYSYQAPHSYVETNVSGTLNVLQACSDHGVERLVHTSSSEVYGTARYTPINENHPLQGQSPYSATKIAADKLAESWFTSFELPVVTIRPFNCFGPRQSGRAFIPAMITQLLHSCKVCCGSLKPLRDFTFVKDTVRGFVACGQKEGIEGETINIGSGKTITMGELLELICKRMQVDPEIMLEDERVRPEKSEVGVLLCDNQKADILLDWRPQWSLEAGLDEVIAYLRKNLTDYKTGKYIR